MWTPQIDVHVDIWSLETGTFDSWLESLDDVLAMTLVHQNQKHLAVNWPFQEWVVFTFHEDEEKRKVSLEAHAITIQVGPDTHLVSIPIPAYIIARL